LIFNKKELKKLLKEQNVKGLGDFNALMSEVSKEVVETLLEGELTDHLGFEKYDHQAKTIDNSRNGFTPKSVNSKYGKMGLNVPRDRKSEFDPKL
jgi:transposase-like protein